MLGTLIRWWVARVNEGREEARARAARKLAQEDSDIALAVARLSQYKVCPSCNTEDAILGWRQDCMDVVADRCYHAWHYYAWESCRQGCLYDGKSRRDALLEYGKKLRLDSEPRWPFNDHSC